MSPGDRENDPDQQHFRVSRTQKKEEDRKKRTDLLNMEQYISQYNPEVEIQQRAKMLTTF
jgi:hypothetical protein